MATKPEVVVVTGASGGVGRAIAHAFAKRGAHIGLVARGEQGLETRGARSSNSAVRRSSCRPTWRSPSRSRPPRSGRRPFRAARHMGERCDGDRLRARRRHERRRIQARDQVTYLGAVYGTMAALKRMTARDSGTIVRSARPVIPRDPAAGCLLRREVRDPRLHGLDPLRAPARQESRPHHDGAATRGQHHPVQLVPIQAAGPSTAGAADLPAGDPRRGGLLGRASPSPRAGVGYSAVEAIVGNKIAPGFADRYLAHKAFSGQQVKNMPVPADRPDNLFAPVPELAATHGMFDDQAKRRSPQLWANTHRAALAGAAVVSAAAGIAGFAATRAR